MTRAPAEARKHERRAIVALFAVFALLVQALIPAAALAGPRLVAGDLICDGGHVRADAYGAPVGQHHRALGGMPCQDCLAAAMAAVAPPAPAVAPVAYAVARVEHAAAAPALEPRARAPPRPPGQGPPTA
jgi:hypothetical protein